MKAPEDPLEQLRGLLLRDEREQLSELREHVLQRPQRVTDLADVLPDAIAVAAALNRNLADAMQAPLTEALRDAVRKNPRSLAQALGPVAVPAMRAAAQGFIDPLARTLWRRPPTDASTAAASETAQSPRQRYLAWLFILAVLSGVAVLGWAQWQRVTIRYQVQSDAEALEVRVRALAERLNTQPGLVIASIESKAGLWVLRGLRDPLAATPDAEIERAGLSDEVLRINWIPFQSLDPSLVERRAALQLRLPPGVRGRLQNGVLVLEGRAALGWIQAAQQTLVLPSGVERIDTGAVKAWEQPGESPRQGQ